MIENQTSTKEIDDKDKEIDDTEKWYENMKGQCSIFIIDEMAYLGMKRFFKDLNTENVAKKKANTLLISIIQCASNPIIQFKKCSYCGQDNHTYSQNCCRCNHTFI